MILKHSRIFSLIIILLSAQLSWAGSITPAANLPTYYSGVNGKSGATLWSAVHTVAAEGFSGLSYNGLWTAYYITDTIPGSTTQIIDMYGGCTFTSSNQDKGSGGTTECDKYNREHSIPKSWFGGSTDATSPGTDLFHVVPADKLVNNKRSNNAFGEVNSAEYTSSIGSKLGTPKAITISNTMLYSGKDTTVNCSTSKVFEPIDDYKGDFARGYFGTLLKWTDYSKKFTTGDGAAMFSDSYTAAGHWGLTPYGIALLMKWHRQDPVSLKEIQRNNKVQLEQGNRNPFIDYPDLAEYIWGSHAGETFYLASSTATYTDAYIATAKTGLYGEDDDTPTLTVSSSSLTVEPVAVNGTSTKTFTVTGANLTGNITITKTSGSGYFTVSPSPITSGYNGSNTITVTYHPTSTGDHTATFTIASSGADSKTVTVSGICTTVYTATWMADGSQYHQNTAASGSAPSVPEAPDDCGDDRVFMGWTDDSDYSGDGSDLFTDSEDAPPITSATTFYAVYADKETSGGDPVETEKFATTSLGSTNSVTTGYTVSATLSAKTGYYQDGSTVGTKYHVNIYNTSTPMFTSTPSSIDLTVSIGGGTAGLSFDNYAYAQLVNASGDTIGTAAKITNYVTTSTGDSYNVSIPTTGVTSAYGIRLYHAKESGKNMRFYSASLSVTTGGTTTTYSNYSTQCSEGTKVTITFNANGGEGTMAAQQVPQSTSRNLNTCTFTRTHYTFNGWNTQANGSGTSYADGASINTSTDLTLYAQWTEASQYTVTFMNMGVAYGEPITDYAGESIGEISNPTACEGYTFVGWSTATQATEATSKPSTTTPTTIPAENTTYHAVYSRTESSGDQVATNNYKKITSKSELTDGNYLIVANNSEAYNAMSTTFKNTYYLEGSSVTPDDDIITTTMANIIWQINVSDDQATIYNATFHYLYIESSTSGTKTYYNIKLGDNTTNNKFSYEVSNGEWIFTSATYTDRQIEYYTTNTRWAYHTSQDAPVYLYKQQYEASSTTYYTTSPNCCKATLTVQSPDDTMGTVSIE